MASNKDYEITLKLKAEIEQALNGLNRTRKGIEDVAKAAAKANTDIAKAPVAAAGLTATDTAMRKTALSAKELAFVTRGLPAQFTDIGVSLASGQRPIMVLLQQGGQLKDMFGGIGPAVRAMGSYLVGLVNPVTIAIAAIAGLAFAWNEAEGEGDGFNRALLLTGNNARLTADDLAAMAQELDRTTNATAGGAADVLTEVASTGRFTAEQIALVSEAAINMKDATGKAIEDTIKEFVQLKGDPLDAILKLNDAQHFLTEQTVEQIQSLIDQGREADAATVVIRAYADAINERSPKVVENLSTWSSIWRGLKTGASEAFDEIVQGFRDADKESSIAIKSIAANMQALSPTFLGPLTAIFSKVFDATAARTAAAQARPDFSNVVAGGETVVDSDQIRAQLEFDKQGLRYAEQRQRMERDIAEARRLGLEAGKSDAEIQARIVQIQADYAKRAKKPKKDPKTDAEKQEDAAVRELANLQKQVALLGTLEDGETKATEAARIRYEVENGAYKLASASVKQQLLDQATQLDAARQQIEINKQLKAVDLTILQLQGKDAAAALQQVIDKLRETRAEAEKQGTPGDVAKVDLAIDLTQKKAEVDAFAAQAQGVFNDIQREQTRIQTEQQAGLITEYDAQQRIVDLYRDKNAVLVEMLPRMEAMAAALGPDAVARVAAIRAELVGMSETTSLLQQQVGQTFQGAFATALEALATRTATLREAVTGFFLDMSRGFAQMASQALSQAAWKKILQVFGVESDVGGGAKELGQAADKTIAAGAAIGIGAAQLMGAAAALAAAGGISAAGGAAGAAAGGSSGSGVNWMSLISSFFADGGHVTGPGTATSDSIVARLSDGEFVNRAAVVQQPGALAFLSDFNQRGMAAIESWASRFSGAQLPRISMPTVPRFRFAEGGLAMAAGGMAPQVNLRNVVAFDRDTVVQELSKSSHLEQVIVNAVVRNGDSIRGGWSS